ncbi:unnamed protein product [Rhizophagus irregularis]|uniref:Uncharacterized protein n=1 Tax=Rhizophagus irregularis TaxID=588596 RepID=A0A915YZJ0_9GLOM|nr:unnamed protein product [Rhizophagus irregularis]
MEQKYSNDDIIEESGNFNVDKLIRDSQINARNSLGKLEWIEYDNFENIEYVAKGDITSEFLNEIRSHLKMNNSERIVKLYGVEYSESTKIDFTKIDINFQDNQYS